MEEQNNREEFSFIKEQIKERPINKRRLLHKVLGAALCGIVFGLAACLSFVVARPKLELLTKPQPDHEVKLPGDQEDVQGEDGEESIDDSQGGQPDDNQEGGSQGGQPDDNQEGQPDDNQGGQPDDSQEGQPDDSQGGQPDDSQEGQPDDSQGDGSQGGQPDDGQGEGGQEGAEGQNPSEPIYVEKELEAVDFQEMQNKLYAIGKRGKLC